MSNQTATPGLSEKVSREQDAQQLVHGPARPIATSADPRVADATPQMVPAEVGFEQQDSDRSICGSDAGISSKSSKGKARVSKVTKRHPQGYITDSKQRLAALGPQAFFDDMMSRKHEL